MPKKLKILLASSEVAPLAKTGGLADVAGALPKALKSLGHDVRVVLPYYSMSNKKKLKVKEEIPVMGVPIAEREQKASVMSTLLADQVPTYLIKQDKYYNREYLYSTPQGDYSDNRMCSSGYCKNRNQSKRVNQGRCVIRDGRISFGWYA